VLCITHLPQIAAKADAHFHIVKRVEEGRATTGVLRLDDKGRVEELGRMLAGSAVSEAVRASAREMLEGGGRPSGAKGESRPKGESERAKAKRPTAR
jgi:DNA repair protein RecN (Recombination protein N)